jgi:hypothetical protein
MCVLEGMLMISLRQRLQSLPLLCGGLAAGLLLAFIARKSGGTQPPAMALLIAAMPFVLAGMTGMAKSTTA